jgi:hypothetical protein
MKENVETAVLLTDEKLTPVEIKKVEEAFLPLILRMNELDKEFAEVIKMEDGKEAVKASTELASKYKKLRTDTGKEHTKQKAYYLAGGRYVDKWKNQQLALSETKECELNEKKMFFINQEKAKLQLIKDGRIEVLNSIGYTEQVDGLEILTDDVFNAMVEGFKLKAQADLDRQVEELRLQKEADDKVKLHNSRKELLIPYWNFVHVDNRNANLSGFTEEEFAKELEDLKIKKQEADNKLAEQELENARLKDEADKTAKRNSDLRPYISMIRNYDEVMALSDNDFATALTDFNTEAIATAKLNAEKERLAAEKLAEQELARTELKNRNKRRQIECLGIGLKFEGDTFKYKTVNISVESIETLTNDLWDVLMVGSTTQMKAIKDSEEVWKQEQEEKRVAEAARLAELEKKVSEEWIEVTPNTLNNESDEVKRSFLIQDIEELKRKYVFTSEPNQVTFGKVGGLFDKVIKYVKETIV